MTQCDQATTKGCTFFNFHKSVAYVSPEQSEALLTKSTWPPFPRAHFVMLHSCHRPNSKLCCDDKLDHDIPPSPHFQTFITIFTLFFSTQIKAKGGKTCTRKTPDAISCTLQSARLNTCAYCFMTFLQLDYHHTAIFPSIKILIMCTLLCYLSFGLERISSSPFTRRNFSRAQHHFHLHVRVMYAHA